MSSTPRYEIRKTVHGETPWKVYRINVGLMVGPGFRLKRDAVAAMKRMEAVPTPRMDTEWDAYQKTITQMTIGPYAYDLRRDMRAELNAVREALMGVAA